MGGMTLLVISLGMVCCSADWRSVPAQNGETIPDDWQRLFNKDLETGEHRLLKVANTGVNLYVQERELLDDKSTKRHMYVIKGWHRDNGQSNGVAEAYLTETLRMGDYTEEHEWAFALQDDGVYKSDRPDGVDKDLDIFSDVVTEAEF